MRKHLWILVSCTVLALVTVPLYAAPTITVEAPVITFVGNTGGTTVDDALNALISGVAFDDAIAAIETQADTELSKFGDQSKLAQGFANANAYSAQSATLQGYQGYKKFALMGGLMVGGQLPSMDLAVLQEIPNTIAEEPDVYAGVAPSMGFNIGLNAGNIFGIFNKDLGRKLKPFYFNIKYGTIDYEYELEDSGNLAMSSTNFGLGVNYQWKPHGNSILFGMFKWRGVNFGSGLNYQNNTVQFSSQIATITQPYSQLITSVPVTPFEGETLTATFAVTPNVNLGIDMTTYSIPLEATTSVQFLWLLNLNLGAGMDLVFGKSNITVDADSGLTVEELAVSDGSTIEYTMTPGKVTLDAGTKDVSPSLARLRLMAGLGAQLGPVKMDIPVYYYFNSGLAFGISFGLVW